MARIFGEINEPESRAFWNDYDDDDDYDESELDASHFQYSLQWTGDNGMPSEIETLLIVEGPVVSEYTKLCTTRDAEEVCCIKHGQHKPSLVNKIDNSLYVCLVSPDLRAQHSAEFTGTIVHLLSIAKKIITVTSQHASSYKSNLTTSQPSFLRSLSTTNTKPAEYEVPRIQQPNIVSGISAAILSYAEIQGFRAVAYILYVDEFVLDSQTAIPLCELYSRIPGCLVKKPNFKPSSYLDNGNLYM